MPPSRRPFLWFGIILGLLLTLWPWGAKTQELRERDCYARWYSTAIREITVVRSWNTQIWAKGKEQSDIYQLLSINDPTQREFLAIMGLIGRLNCASQRGDPVARGLYIQWYELIRPLRSKVLDTFMEGRAIAFRELSARAVLAYFRGRLKDAEKPIDANFTAPERRLLAFSVAHIAAQERRYCNTEERLRGRITAVDSPCGLRR